jgi:hypothetical protein
LLIGWPSAGVARMPQPEHGVAIAIVRACGGFF